MNTTSEPFYRIKDILPILGIKRTFFLDRVRSGEYPPPIKLSPRVAVWPKSTIDDLIARIKAGSI